MRTPRTLRGTLTEQTTMHTLQACFTASNLITRDAACASLASVDSAVLIIGAAALGAAMLAKLAQIFSN